MGRLPAAGLALALAATCAALAGCGAGGLDPAAAAATKSEKAGGAHVTFSMQMSLPNIDGGAPVTLSGNGAIDGAQGEMTLDMGKLLAAAGAPSGTDGSMKELFLEQGGDEVVYLQMALLDPALKGKHWLKLDLSQLGRQTGVDLTKLMGNGSAMQNPGDLLALLKASSGNVDDLGTETVGGATTTHYRATVDLAKAATVQGVSQQAIQQLEAQGAPSRVQEDVWVGSDGLVRQVRVPLDMKANGIRAHMTMTLGYSDWGTHVDLAAPPASDVLDVTQLVQQEQQRQTTTQTTTATP